MIFEVLMETEALLANSNTTASSATKIGLAGELGLIVVLVLALLIVMGILLLILFVRVVASSKQMQSMQQKLTIAIIVIASFIISALELANFVIRIIRCIMGLADLQLEFITLIFRYLAEFFTLWMGAIVLALAVFIAYV